MYLKRKKDVTFFLNKSNDEDKDPRLRGVIVCSIIPPRHLKNVNISDAMWKISELNFRDPIAYTSQSSALLTRGHVKKCKTIKVT